MTVEMERPFVWPEAPSDYSPWNKEQNKMAREESEEMQDKMGASSDAVSVSHEQRKRMREQAIALLEGREKWRPGASGRAAGPLGQT
jgi:large subunit ribosomal protein L23